MILLTFASFLQKYYPVHQIYLDDRFIYPRCVTMFNIYLFIWNIISKWIYCPVGKQFHPFNYYYVYEQSWKLTGFKLIWIFFLSALWESQTSRAYQGRRGKLRFILPLKQHYSQCAILKALHDFQEKRACKWRDMHFFLQNVQNEIFMIFKIFKNNMKFARLTWWINSKKQQRQKHQTHNIPILSLLLINIMV